MLSPIRQSLEDENFLVRQQRYAQVQRNQWSNIVGYLKALTTSKSDLIPSAERAAYFEWAVWRAFLAINSLANAPWESRRFPVYGGTTEFEEFLPHTTAPANGPDLVFEFQDFVLVVDVTLKTSDRQVGECESVRRHVADYVQRFKASDRQVYGLFLSTKIDSNTAETFRISIWYQPDDSQIALQIVPWTLEQFMEVFESSFQHGCPITPTEFKHLLRDCLVDRNADALIWKQCIDSRIGLFSRSRSKKMINASGQPRE